MKKFKFWSEFKEFAMRGNMIDMAVGIIVGGAFGNLVNSFVNDILMPPLGVLIGGMDFSDLSWRIKPAVIDPHTGQTLTAAVTWNYGSFIQNIINFLIIAFAIFLFVRLINTLKRKQEAAPVPAAKPEDVQLLSEIRDLLKEQQNRQEENK